MDYVHERSYLVQSSLRECLMNAESGEIPVRKAMSTELGDQTEVHTCDWEEDTEASHGSDQHIQFLVHEVNSTWYSQWGRGG